MVDGQSFAAAYVNFQSRLFEAGEGRFQDKAILNTIILTPFAFGCFVPSGDIEKHTHSSCAPTYVRRSDVPESGAGTTTTSSDDASISIAWSSSDTEPGTAVSDAGNVTPADRTSSSSSSTL